LWIRILTDKPDFETHQQEESETVEAWDKEAVSKEIFDQIM
jgi:hypothetical protein